MPSQISPESLLSARSICRKRTSLRVTFLPHFSIKYSTVCLIGRKCSCRGITTPCHLNHWRAWIMGYTKGSFTYMWQAFSGRSWCPVPGKRLDTTVLYQIQVYKHFMWVHRYSLVSWSHHYNSFAILSTHYCQRNPNFYPTRFCVILPEKPL